MGLKYITSKVIAIAVVLLIKKSSEIPIGDLGDALGDFCRLSNGETGECKLDKDCENFGELFRFKKIISCGFSGINQIICCKKTFISRISAQCDYNVSKRPRKPATLNFHINDGDRSSVGEFPHMAAIGYDPFNSSVITFDCGGILISEYFVLTAAHCVNMRNNAPKMVRLGRTNLNISDLSQDDNPAVDVKVKVSCYVNIHYINCNFSLKINNLTIKLVPKS